MRHILLLLTILFSLTCHAATDGDLTQQKGADTYNFWIYSPAEYREDKHPLPLIVFLHGASLCGRNMQKVRRYGVLHAIDKGLPMPMFVVAPQNPGGAWNPEKLSRMIDYMEENYAIDRHASTSWA